MKNEPNEENCSVSDSENTGPLSEVTAESAAVEAGTLPEPTMEEKKVEPEAMPEVNPESVPAGDLGINEEDHSTSSHNMGERLDQTHEKNVETRMLLECKPTQILSDFLQAPQKRLEMIQEKLSCEVCTFKSSLTNLLNNHTSTQQENERSARVHAAGTQSGKFGS